MAEVISVTIVDNVLTIIYDEAMTLENPSGVEFKTSLGATINVSNFTGGGTNTWTLTLDTTITSTDYLVGVMQYGAIRNDSYQYLSQGTMFVGGSGITTMDFSETGINYPSPYMFFTGEGSDTIATPVWSADIINLSESTPASDTVGMGDQWSTRPLDQIDLITGFDVSGTSTNDKLSFQSKLIAANVTDANGTDVGTIATHSITSGIVTFKNSSGITVAITDDTLLADAYNYLHTNLSVPGTTVAFEAGGIIDALIVFQRGSAELGSTLIALDGISGVTLGTAAATNVVQIIDTSAPLAQMASATSNGLTVHFAEAVTAIDISDIKLYKNGTSIDMGTITVSGLGTANITLSTPTSITSTDFVVFDASAIGVADNMITDAFGNTGALFSGLFLTAIGGSGNNTIDLTLLSGVDEAEGKDGDDILIGNDNDNWIAGGSGNDTISGGNGNDELVGDDAL
ncbi:MAG: hypothetical protein PHR02_10770, partial [Sulfuricurvum sp.]|nr:hypothetical protein [Sulfuricurvum sp.]